DPRSPRRSAPKCTARGIRSPRIPRTAAWRPPSPSGRPCSRRSPPRGRCSRPAPESGRASAGEASVRPRRRRSPPGPRSPPSSSAGAPCRARAGRAHCDVPRPVRSSTPHPPGPARSPPGRPPPPDRPAAPPASAGPGERRCKPPPASPPRRSRHSPARRCRSAREPPESRRAPPTCEGCPFTGKGELRQWLLGGERRERGTLVPLPQPLQCPIPQLPDTLPRHTQDVADLLQRVLTPALQPEVQAKHLRVPRLKRLQSPTDPFREEPLLHLFLREDRFVRDESIHQLRVIRIADRRIQPDLGGVQRLQALDDFRRKARCDRQLLRAGVAPELLLQTLPLPEDLRQVGGPVQRHTYRPALVRQRRQNRLSDPQDGVRDELHPLLRIELPGGGDESDIPLLDQTGEADAALLILLRDRDDEAEAGANQLLDRGFIASLGTTTEL